MRRKNLAYDAGDIALWAAAFGARMPARAEPGTGLPVMIVHSLRVGHTATHAHIRLAAREGEPADVILNPFVAAQLIDALRLAGRARGWLDGDGRLILPAPRPAKPSSARPRSAR